MPYMNSVADSYRNEVLPLTKVEEYLRNLDLNQKNIVTISKTSTRLNIEKNLTQYTFDILEKEGIIKKKYALLCPDCSHILNTKYDDQDLMVLTSKTCCDDSEFYPTEEDIYVFYEVVAQKKAQAPVENAKDVNSSENANKGLQNNLTQDDSLKAYLGRLVEQGDKKLLIESSFLEEFKIMRKNYESNKRFSKNYKIVYTVYILGSLALIKFLEVNCNIDINSTISALTYAAPVIPLWLHNDQ